MTCHRIGNAIVCINPSGSMKVGEKRIYVDFHHYCGPTFYTDRGFRKMYEPTDENDPVWESFARWLRRYESRKARAKERQS